MKITIVSTFFPPEKGAAPTRIFNMAKALQEKGADVEIITALPNYPTGKIFEEYRGKILHQETIEGLNTRRYWLYPSNSSNPILRVFSMVSFSLSIWLSLFHLLKTKPDVIIIESPPLFTGFMGSVLGKLVRRSKVVINVSDIWPLSALELGAIQKGRFYAAIERLERQMYANADALIGQSNETLRHIAKNLKEEKPLFLYRNLSERSPFIHQSIAFQAGKLKVVYAGLLGVAQGVFEICKNVDFKNLGVEFHIYGAGNELEAIQQYIQQNPDCNIFLHGMIPQSEVQKMLTNYHITIIPLKNPIYGAFPSKIFMAIAAAMPLIFSGEGEGAEVTKQYAVGKVCASGDFQSLEKLIETFNQMSEPEFQNFRRNCLTALETDFDFAPSIERLYQFLNALK